MNWNQRKEREEKVKIQEEMFTKWSLCLSQSRLCRGCKNGKMGEWECNKKRRRELGYYPTEFLCDGRIVILRITTKAKLEQKGVEKVRDTPRGGLRKNLSFARGENVGDMSQPILSERLM